MVLQILLFVGVLAALVLVHEWGHFIVARRAGIKVEEFGFGFPPRLWAWKGKLTTYSLNALPFGGFVRLKGEEGGDAQDKDSFASKRASTLIALLLAGVVMNVALAAAFLSFGFMIGVPAVIDSVVGNGTVKDARIQILSVAPGSPAAKVGIYAGNEIVEVQGYGVHAADLLRAIERSAATGASIELRVRENESPRTVVLTPTPLKETGKPGIGVTMVETGIVSYPWYIAWYKGIQQTGMLLVEIIKGIGGLIVHLFQGVPVGDAVAGPVGIAVITGQVARQGLGHLVQFVAILSLNLAVLNVVPFPGLDGGRLLFIGIEKMRGRPVTRRIESLSHMIGFMLLLALVAVVTVRDVKNIGVLSSLFGS